MQPDAMLVN